jgi:aspartyl/asparaginyl beta-hydroxylase (cupin superfamily)
VDDVKAELARRCAHFVDHARGSLEQHLAGVHAVLGRWSQPDHVQLAGLLHSAYSTETFEHILFDRSERARVRELVGVDAERLVFAFSGCTRRSLLDGARATSPRDAVVVPTRWRHETASLSRDDLAHLMRIHAANLAEQVARPRGGAARWLATASELLASTPVDGEGPTPLLVRLFGHPRAMTRLEERQLLDTYRALHRRGGQPSGGATSTVETRALATSPVGEPLVLASLLALADERVREAVTFAERALARFDAWGVAWDKRLSLGRWRELALTVARDGSLADGPLRFATARARAALLVARGSPARLWAELDSRGALVTSSPSPPPSAKAGAAQSTRDRHLPPRFEQYIRGLHTNTERPLMQFYPGLRATPWHDPREFAIVADLERLAADIAREARAFDPRHFQDEAESIGRKGRWGVLFLLEMGRPDEENLARSPSLRGVLERHRTLTTHAGLMYFSCLDPHTRIAPHQGPTNVRVRCHLGLDIPEGCGIRVGGEVRRWEEGRCLVLDDSFTHEAWNDSDRPRLVLVVDLWHPDLTDEEVDLLAGLHRYGAANGAGARRYWARNEEARERARARAASTSSTRGRSEVGGVTELDGQIGAALRSGDLELASERAARYAELCRGSRWYPVPRETDPVLPEAAGWAPVLTPSKLVHDIEQLRYLAARGILAKDSPAIIAEYEDLLDTLRPLGDEARVPLVGAAQARVGHAYNRLLHVRQTPRVTRALGGSWDPSRVEDDYERSRPNVVVVDDFLAEGALESLRLFCLESTVWSTNRYDHGRLGSFFRDGFNCPLLVQIAEELRAALPRVIGARHPVGQIWGYKYATTQPSLPPHADFSAVSVNLWITPDEANLAPGEGGLVVYDVAAPRDWDFATYNRDASRIRALLAAKGARETRIAYRCNRAVIFDSDLFHGTPALRFREGYENRRVNVTVLFGDRHQA